MTELHAADPNEDARQKFAAAFPESILYSDAQEMLASEAREDDIVILAVPPWLHLPLAEMALRSGRHVLCEKPLGLNAEEARRMLAVATENKRHLACCSNRFLGYQATNLVKKMLLNNRLGDVLEIQCHHVSRRSRAGIEYQPESRWFLDKSKAGGGILLDWGVYDMTMLFDTLGAEKMTVEKSWMASPKTAVDPQNTIFDVETMVWAQLDATLPGGRHIPVSYRRGSCSHGEEENLLQITGTEGSLRWDFIPWERNWRPRLIWSYDRDGRVVDEVYDFDERHTLSCHSRPLVYFTEWLRTGEAPALVDDAALQRFDLINELYRKAAGVVSSNG
jgi:predicted dehydrogenase